ncbi:basic leucine zipper transcriptional factor ATF-like 2 [Myxocyprinus asiaticus]|uniref:basic leucine zipper transcriptional factor ATF-like 2 n=1 Tax=Myxocyprinus asiaticus TaxID=70543 RepID=UPI002222E0FC|nr:basic leucine zipper transcriptional factor ATF-like 2 [Myxocyprinus asiaticus]
MTNMRGPEHLAEVCLLSSTGEISTSKDKPANLKGLLPLSGSSILAQRLFRLPSYRNPLISNRHRKREMTPAERKDASYWDKRQKNNEAAKRSREKRRLNDFMLEDQLLALSKENAQLRAEVLSLQYHIGRGLDVGHPMTPFHYPIPSHLKPSLWGFAASNAPLPADGPELYHCWPQYGTCSGPPVSFSPLISPLRILPKRVNIPSKINHPDDKLSNQSIPNTESVEQDQAAHPQVSSSNDPPSHPQQLPAQRAAASSHSSSQHPSQLAQSWLLPGLSHHTTQHNNQLLPWGSSSLHQTPLHPSWPLSYPLSLRDPDESLNEARSLRNFNSRFSVLSAEILQLRRILSTENS